MDRSRRSGRSARTAAGLLAGYLAAAVTTSPAADAPRRPSAAPRAYVIGRSVEDRPILVRRLGDPSSPTKVLVVGSIHGDEPQGVRIVRRLERSGRPARAGLDLWTVRSANPDGLAAGTRGNGRGVDLNRNFPLGFDPSLDGGYESGPRPLSEPESRAIARLARRNRFDLAIWLHQPWGRTLVPCEGDRRAARRYAALSGLAAGPSCDRPYPGSVSDWMGRRLGASAFVVELPARPLRPAEIERHARAVVRLGRELKP